MPNYTTVVDVQVTALLSRVRSLQGLSAQAGAQLATAWAAGTWTAEQSNAFTTALGGAVAASTSTQGQGRRSCQDIQNFDPYLNISDMEILQGDANAHTKIECVVSRCCKLGLVLPSESSTRMIMAACFGAGVPAATHEEKFGMVKEFKRQLKAKVAKMPKSSTHLQRYPPTPAHLPPALLQDAYSADDPPVGQNQQLPAHLVQEMAQGTALRRMSKHVRQNMPLQASNASNTGAAMLATLGLGAPGLPLLNMLQSMQQQVQQGAMPQTQHGGMPPVNLPGFTWRQPSRTPALTASDFARTIGVL